MYEKAAAHLARPGDVFQRYLRGEFGNAPNAVPSSHSSALMRMRQEQSEIDGKPSRVDRAAQMRQRQAEIDDNTGRMRARQRVAEGC